MIPTYPRLTWRNAFASMTYLEPTAPILLFSKAAKITSKVVTSAKFTQKVQNKKAGL